MKSYRIFEEENKFVGRIVESGLADLPKNEVVIRVLFSGVNYKDYLSSIGNKGITKEYPHTPGIDAAGIVESDQTGSFSPGTEVVVMGYDLGMNTDGGFAEYISVPAAWVMHCPENLTLEETMIIGTSGLTATLGIDKMLRMGQSPAMGPIVVSGASGGVGSFAVRLLSQLGFEVWAASGKSDDGYLTSLGATAIIDRSEIDDTSGKPLLRPRWGGAFDSVGGNTLHTLLKTIRKNGCVATCGSVGGTKLDMTVFPFILNGVNLLGINTADTIMSERIRLWQLHSKGWKPVDLDKVARFIGLEELPAALRAMGEGSHTGRFVCRF